MLLYQEADLILVDSGLTQEKSFLFQLRFYQENSEVSSYIISKKLSLNFIISYLKNNCRFNDFMSSLYNKEWIVYCKPPFKNSGCVVEYLGRYTHRVAISNNRILKLEDGQVTFKWRDYKDNNNQKNMKLTVDEFIRRFLIHVLPNGFTKIRHYGLLSPRNKATKLKLCKKLTNTILREVPKVKLSTLDFLEKLTGKDFTICPSCGVGHLSRAAPDEAAIA